jgi:hypothetical protein
MRSPDLDGVDLRLEACVVRALRGFGSLHPREALAFHALQDPHDVVDLALEHVPDRPVVRVRTVEHEQVREAGGRDTEVGVRTVAPRVRERAAIATDDRDGREEARRLKAGREHDRVEWPLDAVRRRDAAARDARDRLRDQLDVRVVERGIPAVRDQRAIASVRDGRRELPARRRVADGVDRAEARLGRRLQHARIRERDGRLDAIPDLAPRRQGEGGVGDVARDLLVGEGIVVLGQHPLRRALEYVQPRGPGRDRGHELHGARGAPDDRRAGPSGQWSRSSVPSGRARRRSRPGPGCRAS